MDAPKPVLKPISKGRCLFRSALWFISNALFGLAPLLSLCLVNPILSKHSALEEIHKLMQGGTILFVCCALMGAVIIDILIENVNFKSKVSFFAFNVAPFLLLGIICFLYIMIIVGEVNESVFTTFSKFYIFVIIFTIGYCTFGKYFIYLKTHTDNG